MAEYATSLTVPHRPEEMFELVADIARYPDFIRWIRSMSVTGEREEGGVRHALGDARVGFKGFSERFATTVKADPEALTVEADLVRGPFRRLHNVWRFTPDGDGARIDFHIDYEFRSLILKALAAANLDLAVRKIMNAFLVEADRRYGAP